MFTLYETELGFSLEELKKAIPLTWIRVVGKIDMDTVETVRKKVEKVNDNFQPVLPIAINSWGGEIEDAFAITDLLDRSLVPIATVVYGRCYSCALLISSSGHAGLRYAAPNSSFMYHEPTGEISGKVKEMNAYYTDLKRWGKRFEKRISDNCGAKKKEFLKFVKGTDNADAYFQPSVARNVGIIDHISMPQFRVEVTHNVLFE